MPSLGNHTGGLTLRRPLSKPLASAFLLDRFVWALIYISHFFNPLILKLPFPSRSVIPFLPPFLSEDNFFFFLFYFCLCAYQFFRLCILPLILPGYFLLLSVTGERQASCVWEGCHFRVNYAFINTPQCYRLSKINGVPRTRSFELT